MSGMNLVSIKQVVHGFCLSYESSSWLVLSSRDLHWLCQNDERSQLRGIPFFQQSSGRRINVSAPIFYFL